MKETQTVTVEAKPAEEAPPAPPPPWKKIAEWWNALPTWQKITLISLPAISIATIALTRR